MSFKETFKIHKMACKAALNEKKPFYMWPTDEIQSAKTPDPAEVRSEDTLAESGYGRDQSHKGREKAETSKGRHI
jgi:hypothetical protein